MREPIWEPEGYVCAFSGHRPPKLPFGSEDDPKCVDLKLRLKKEIHIAVEEGCTDFLCGMALGCDTWAAEAVLEVKQALQAYRTVHLRAYLPFPGQDQRWSAKNRRRYRQILNGCTTVTYVCETYQPDCMQKRNRAMIDRADRLIAVFDGQKGGTSETLRMAHEKGIELRILSPVPPVVSPAAPPDGDPQIKLF